MSIANVQEQTPSGFYSRPLGALASKGSDGQRRPIAAEKETRAQRRKTPWGRKLNSAQLARIEELERAHEDAALQWKGLDAEAKLAVAAALLKTLKAVIPTYDFGSNMHVQLAMWQYSAPPTAHQLSLERLKLALEGELSASEHIAVVQVAAVIELLAISKKERSAAQALQLLVQGTDDILRFALAATSRLCGMIVSLPVV